MTDLITELKALKEKATPDRPWEPDGVGEATQADLEFVCALVNNLPTILAKLEEADRVEAWLVERFMLMAGAGPFCELCHDYLPHKTDCPLSPVRKTTLAALESTHDHT